MIKDILRLKMDVRLSHEQIARSLAISKGVVGKYVGLAKKAGLDWSPVHLMNEAEIDQRLRARPRQTFDIRLINNAWDGMLQINACCLDNSPRNLCPQSLPKLTIHLKPEASHELGCCPVSEPGGTGSPPRRHDGRLARPGSAGG
jgi:hypothetical protein